MHEGAIALEILRLAQNQARTVIDATDITVVSVAAGEFRNIDGESLVFAYDALKIDFPELSRSSLEVLIVPALARCNGIGHEYRPTIQESYKCPACGGGIARLLQGEELELRSFETESLGSKQNFGGLTGNA